MNIRRVVLDIDKALKRPTMVELAEAIVQVAGVEGANLFVNAIDMETMGLMVAIEGDDIDLEALTAAIESVGAVVHSTDELAVGSRIVEGARLR